MAQVNAGRVRFVSRGEYNNTTQYYLFDLVNYEGSSYVAIGNTLGNLPTNTTYWQLIAEHGPIGSTGPVGPQGVGIASITKTSSEGLVDTYTITYTDGTTSTFNITNGEDGETPLSEFNALKVRVEDLEDNQITKEVEGTIIHVEDAHSTRLYDFELTKESTQEGTPTPDNPVEVKTIKGYRNLLDDTVFINAYLTTSGNIVNDNKNALFDYIEVNSSNIILSSSQNLYRLNIAEFDSNKNFILLTYGRNININSITLQNNTKYIRVAINYNNSSNITQDVINNLDLQIVESNEQLPYVPYGNNYVDVKVTGKNLFDGQIELGGIDATTGQNVTSNYRTRSKNYIEVQPNTTYTFTKQGGAYRHILAYDKNKNYLSINLEFTSNTYTFTTNSETYYIRWYDTQYTNVNEHVQIEEGTTATTYEPYKETIIPIPLNGNEIAGIGNYLDELIVDKEGKVYLNKVYFKKNFDGSETWFSYNNYGTDTIGWATTLENIISTSYNVNNIFSNKFAFKNIYNVDIEGCNHQNKNYLLKINKNRLNGTTKNDFLNYLQTEYQNGTPLVLYYPLETPELIDLNTTVDIRLFKGINNITNSEDADMKIRYVQDTQLLFNNFDERLKALEQGQSL